MSPYSSSTCDVRLLTRVWACLRCTGVRQVATGLHELGRRNGKVSGRWNGGVRRRRVCADVSALDFGHVDVYWDRDGCSGGISTRMRAGAVGRMRPLHEACCDCSRRGESLVMIFVPLSLVCVDTVSLERCCARRQRYRCCSRLDGARCTLEYLHIYRYRTCILFADVDDGRSDGGIHLSATLAGLPFPARIEFAREYKVRRAETIGVSQSVAIFPLFDSEALLLIIGPPQAGHSTTLQPTARLSLTFFLRLYSSWGRSR